MCVEERDRYMSLRNYPRETGKGEQRREKEDTGRAFILKLTGPRKRPIEQNVPQKVDSISKTGSKLELAKKKKKNVCQVLDVLSNFKQLKY